MDFRGKTRAPRTAIWRLRPALQMKDPRHPYSYMIYSVKELCKDEQKVSEMSLYKPIDI